MRGRGQRGLDDDQYYVLDLCQTPSGMRWIEWRSPSESPAPSATLTTIALSGARLRSFLHSRQICGDVTTEDGDQFGLDPHNVWMLLDEVMHCRYIRENDLPWDTDGPWVNGIPPQLPPA